MTTEAIDRSRGAAANDTSERAQQAVKVFRGMQYGLTAYAKAITGDKGVRVEISSGPPRTTGKIIYYRPPIELGDKTPHDRFTCDKRGSDGLQRCTACRVREEVLVNIYHEIAHIAFGTFAETNAEDRRSAINEAVKEWGGKYEERIKKQISNAPQNVVSSYMGLAHLISPFLPSLFNCLEDARVDSSMFRARKGTRKMLEADTFNLLSQGVPDAEGNLHKYEDTPLNSQIALACYFQAAGYVGWEEYLLKQVGEHIADPHVAYLLKQVSKTRSAAEVYKLAFPILARLRELGYFQLDDDEEQTDGTEDQEQNDSSDDESESEEEADASDAGSGVGSDSDGVPDSEGESDSEGDSTDSGGAQNQDEHSTPEDKGGDRSSEETSEDAGEETSLGEEGDSSPARSDGEDFDPEGQSEDDKSSGDSPGGVGESDSAEEEGEGNEPSSEAGADETKGGSEVDDSDQDGVPEESGDAGQSAESNGSSDVEEQPADGVDSEADSSEQSQDSGSPQEGGRSVGSDLDNDSEVQPSEGNELDPFSLDDSEGDGKHQEGESTLQDSNRQDGELHPESSTEGRDDRDGEGSEQQVSEPDDDASLVDSGADEGKGGIEVEEDSARKYGTADDVSAALEHMHTQDGESHIENTAAELTAITMAIIQGFYFETPSYGVSEVQEHHYAPDAHGWDSSKYTPIDKIRFGIDCDMDIPEQVLGPALLKTRRIFSDNQTAVHENNLRSGRVNAKVLGKRAWNQDDRLFGKKRIPGKRNYAVSIGIDVSSSNQGSNLALVKRSAFAQAELCHRVGVEFQIVAHSCSVISQGGKRKFVMHLHHIKDWTEPWDSLIKKRISELVAVGGNLDGHALEFMRKQLARVEATDKILLYYTDGKMPAANHNEELEVLTRQLKLCKRDQITLLGIGMGTDSPARHGMDTVQVDDDSDLAGVVEHLGKRLLRRAR